jgi:agmatinase
MSDPRFFPPRNFLGIPDDHSRRETSRVVVLPVPYDSTVTAQVGARGGPRAIIDASEDMETYDIGLGREPYLVGIHTLPELEVLSGNAEAMVQRIEEVVGELIDEGKFVVTLGGEHTVASGAARAYASRYPGLTVLAFDAHADLRDSYLGSSYNHACTLRRILDVCPVVQIGLRSAAIEEHEFIRESHLPFYGVEEFRALADPVAEILGHLGEQVYITIDLDGLDPSIMAAVGTPEPGGLLWQEITSLLASVARERNIVGFDVTELAPHLGPFANAELAAKLAYRLIGLALPNAES